jgi:hypothetical protein
MPALIGCFHKKIFIAGGFIITKTFGDKKLSFIACTISEGMRMFGKKGFTLARV